MKKQSITVKSKADAQSRVDQIRSFQTELEQIEKENIISLDENQQNSIVEYHENLITQMSTVFDIDSNKREKQFSLGMKIASFLGAVALASSVFFFFYQFWGGYSTSIQVLILVSAPLIALAGTMFVAYRDSTGYFSKLLGLITCACFTLNIIMLGQIFNIIPSQNIFLVLGVFALLLAYVSDARLLLIIGLTGISCFISTQAASWSGIYWLNFGMRPETFLPAAIILFLIPAFISHKKYSGFDSAYRIFASILFFISLFIMSHWGASSYFSLSNKTIEGIYLLAGFIFSVGAIWLGIRKSLPAIANVGSIFFIIFLYSKFYDWWWEWMPKYLFFMIIGLTAILALIIFKQFRSESRKNIKVVL